jgi:hypothetical protein
VKDRDGVPGRNPKFKKTVSYLKIVTLKPYFPNMSKLPGLKVQASLYENLRRIF